VHVKRRAGPLGVHNAQAAARARREVASARALPGMALSEPLHGVDLSTGYKRNVMKNK